MSEPLSPERKISQLENLVLVICLLLIFILSARAPLDTDMWWHLRAGTISLETGKPLLSDVFSFTKTGASWMNHSWLAEVGMAFLFRWLGFSGLALGVSLVACLSMLLVWQCLSGNPLLKAVWILTCAVFCSLVWAPRPQIVSLLFLAGLQWLIVGVRDRNFKSLWIVVPLFALWSNLHAGYSLGLILIAAIVAGDVFDWLVKGTVIPTTKPLALWGIAGGLATLVNPNGINTWRVLFETVDVKALQQFISEWASPDFHELTQLIFLIFFMLCVFLLMVKKESLAGEDLAKLISFGLLAFYARRNIAPFAIIAIPMVSKTLNQLIRTPIDPSSPLTGVLDQIKRWFARANREENPILTRLRKGINLILVTILFTVGLGKLIVVSHPVMVNRYIYESYPMRGMEWLKENQPAGNLLNEYDWGGFLIWNVPDNLVFVDGRTDLYGDKVLSDWITLVQAGENTQSLLDQYQIQTIMLRPDRPLVKLLAGQGWEVKVNDSAVVILERQIKDVN